MRVAYGLAYGGIVALAYIILKLASPAGGLPLFCLACAVLFSSHLILWPRRTVSSFFEWRNLSRGILYAITQVLVIRAQAGTSTSTMFLSSLAGSITGSLLGILFLRELPRRVDVIAVVLSLGAVVMTIDSWQQDALAIASLALVGGIISGASTVLARSLMVDQNQTMLGSVASGVAIAAAASLLALALDGQLATLREIAPWNGRAALSSALLAAAGLAIVQYAFFWLYRLLNTQKAAIISLSKIPWALGLESAYLHQSLPAAKIAASFLIVGSAVITLLWKNKPRRELQSETTDIYLKS